MIIILMFIEILQLSLYSYNTLQKIVFQSFRFLSGSVQSTDTLRFVGLSFYQLYTPLFVSKLLNALDPIFYFLTTFISLMEEFPNCYSSLFFSIISFLFINSSPFISLFTKTSDLDLRVIVLSFRYLILFISLSSCEFTMVTIFLESTCSFQE